MSNDCIYYTKPGEKLLFHYAENFLFEEVPKGTRVVYAPPPLEAITAVKAATEEAIENPLGCPPLSAQLRPGMKVTVAIDDLSLPLPPMQRPDLRQLILEVVLEKLASGGVTDIHLIVATGLHRRMTEAEIRHCVGAKVLDAFYPDRLYNHDAEDKENIEYLGETEKGEVVEINGRAAQSDLLIYVNMNLSSMDGGNKSVLTGLSTYRSLKHHHNVHALMHSQSYMHPPSSELHHVLGRMGKVLEENQNIFHIETTLDTNTFPKAFGFLQKQERHLNAFDKLNLHVSRGVLAMTPASVRRKAFMQMRAPYGMTSIQAGKNESVHEKTLENVLKQQVVPVEGQSDVLLAGVPYIGPYNVNSMMNPLLIVNLTAGYLFNLYIGKPLVRRGGVMILFHPLERMFHPLHHPSYIEFFDRVLTQTKVAAEIEKYEEEFACNERYIDLFRNSYAYHGAHPFYMWYWGCYAMEYLSKIIVVKARDKEVATTLGFDTAKSLPEAIEMAQSTLSQRSVSITQFHWPPLWLCEVS